jgi:hypothetical protein
LLSIALQILPLFPYRIAAGTTRFSNVVQEWFEGCWLYRFITNRILKNGTGMCQTWDELRKNLGRNA